MKRLLAALALTVVAGAAHGQGVGINTTGAPADTSAILDLSSTAKGLLPPRMTAAQRASIVLPATGLVVYQTDGQAGLYYNTGTPAAPGWKLVADAAALAGSGPWELNDTAIYFLGGPVGIGTTDPTHPLTVLGTDSGLRVQTDVSGGTIASFGGFGTIEVDAPGSVGGRLKLAENGNLGLGVTNPTNKLSFAPVLGKKISLYPGATGDVGFGVAGNRLQIYADNPNADVAIGYDAAGMFNERFAVKANGALAVNGSEGSAGQVLRSNGPGTPPTWGAATNAAYQNTYMATSTQAVTFSETTPQHTPIPGMAISFSTDTPSKVLVSWSLSVYRAGSCTDCFLLYLLVVDGDQVNSFGTALGVDNVNSVPGSHPLELAAGAHQVELRFARVDVPIIFGIQGAWSSMTAQVIPQ